MFATFKSPFLYVDFQNNHQKKNGLPGFDGLDGFGTEYEEIA